jgi:head-tail adaptor
VIDEDLLPHTITVLTAGQTTDAYGNTVADWSAATSRQVSAYVRPTSTSVRPAGDEYVDVGRDVVQVAWQVHTNDLNITALQRVIHAGITYEIDGKPLVWDVAPDGEVGFSKFGLRRVDG